MEVSYFHRDPLEVENSKVLTLHEEVITSIGKILTFIQMFTVTLNWKIMPGHVGKDAWTRRKRCLGTSEKMPGHVENEAWGVRSQPSPQFNMGSVIGATGESWIYIYIYVSSSLLSP